MQIDAKTKIAALIKGHPEALEAIVTLSPHFRKLRHPILRKMMAGRTSIAEAAKIGGCTTEDFFSVLAPLGFATNVGAAVNGDQALQERTPETEHTLVFDPSLLVTLDVRAMLAGGTDPLQLIQQAVKQLSKGQALCIINTFEPTPLIRLLGQQGFKAQLNRMDDQLVATYFYKVDDAPVASPNIEASGDWEGTIKRFSERLVEIDVRHLEMPAPMMSILEALDSLPEGKALFVHHKRVPVFLLTELKDREFGYRINESPEGVKLLIFREKA